MSQFLRAFIPIMLINSGLIATTTTGKSKNCAELKLKGDSISGVRTVYPLEGFEDFYSVKVYCDQDTDGGGWTVIQNRDVVPVREDFDRTWNEYAQGFGNLTSEFWLGLKNIHALTSSTGMELRVDLEDSEGVKRFAKYGTFHVGDSSTKYVLRIGDYSGDAGDGFTPSGSASVNINGMNFSTHDQDNDLKLSGSCASIFKGGWWFNDCHRSHLNGLEDKITWYYSRGGFYSLKKANMKIRLNLMIVNEGNAPPATTPPSAPLSGKVKNCAELKLINGDPTSGVRTVYPDDSSKEVVVFCDQVTDGGGWTVIQSRSPLPIRENFYRNWTEYVKGFGDPEGEFWLGLDNIHALTNLAQMELRIDLEDDRGRRKFALYSTFHVGDAASKYVLRIANYSGDAGDGMTDPSYEGYNLNGMKFSTQDNENDLHSGLNCAELYKGGWWYNCCSSAQLNGLPAIGYDPSDDGIRWQPFHGWSDYSMKKASMRIRPVSLGF